MTAQKGIRIGDKFQEGQNRQPEPQTLKKPLAIDLECLTLPGEDIIIKQLRRPVVNTTNSGLLLARLLRRETQMHNHVERWGLFELALKGHQNGNPFVDTTLSAQFRYKNRVVEVDGFYDGDNVYRIRFMPDKVGYVAKVPETCHPENPFRLEMVKYRFQENHKYLEFCSRYVGTNVL